MWISFPLSSPLMDDAISPEDSYSWDERSFACRLCPCKYVRKEKLRQHLQKHHQITLKVRASKRPVVGAAQICHCGRQYKCPKQFDVHLRTHDAALFKCTACPKGFTSRSLRRSHELECLQMHPVTKDELGNTEGEASFVVFKSEL